MTTLTRSHQQVPFKLIQMPCCGQAVCWVNPRLPNCCPECGTNVMATIKECIVVTDDNAMLTVHDV